MESKLSLRTRITASRQLLLSSDNFSDKHCRVSMRLHGNPSSMWTFPMVFSASFAQCRLCCHRDWTSRCLPKFVLMYALNKRWQVAAVVAAAATTKPRKPERREKSFPSFVAKRLRSRIANNDETLSKLIAWHCVRRLFHMWKFATIRTRIIIIIGVQHML